MAARDRSRKLGWVGMLEFILDHVVTRIVLSVAIILSLVPHEWMHANDLVFLLLFLPEFVARSILACRSEAGEQPEELAHAPPAKGWKAPAGAEVFLLSVDFVALVSFLPLTGVFASQTRWLRLFRLSRTVMLLRYWAPLVNDLWTVLRRRERARQLTLMGIAVAVTAFAGTVFLNHATDVIGEDFDGDGIVGDDHDHVFWVRMWWAFRQIQDPGNMLASPHEFATLVVSIFLTVFGLFLISFLIGVGTDVVAELMDLSRLRSSGLRRHTVLINLTTSTHQLLYEVMGEFKKLVPPGLRFLSPRWIYEVRRRMRQQREFVVVGRGEEPPDFLREPEFARIIYREHSDEDDEAFLARADVPAARRVVMMADIEQDEPDDDTVRTLITIVERLNEELEVDETARTTLIAEILDESNIGAAEKAIVRAGRRLDAHVIPTERLVALFAYCVARRGGVAKLLVELMASFGHELYTLDYRHSESHGGQVPPMPTSSSAALESLYWRGVGRPGGRQVVPVGILMADPASDPRKDARVVLNPGPMDAAAEVGESFAGFVALAPNLRVAAEFADEVLVQPNAAPPPTPPGQFGLPHLSLAPTNSLRRVLICGFRPAKVNLVEAIITTEPEAEILILVENEEARQATLDAFDAHTNLVRSGLLEGVRGTFVSAPEDPDVLQAVPGAAAGQTVTGMPTAGHVYIEVGEFTSSRQLMKLPRDFGAAPDVDLIVMVSSDRHGSDASTATALMKLEHLQDHIAERSGGVMQQMIVAEVTNAELAHRLDRRYKAMGIENVIVYSMNELRAFFMFQSVVVPNFYLIYGQLMAPWGQSFVKLQAAGDRHGTCTFAQLAAQMKLSGRIPIAVELRDPNGEVKLFIGRGDPETGDLIDLSRLVAVWIVRIDHTSDETIRYDGESLPPPVVAVPTGPEQPAVPTPASSVPTPVPTHAAPSAPVPAAPSAPVPTAPSAPLQRQTVIPTAAPGAPSSVSTTDTFPPATPGASAGSGTTTYPSHGDRQRSTVIPGGTAPHPTVPKPPALGKPAAPPAKKRTDPADAS